MSTSKFNKEEFDKVAREDITLKDMEEMMGQVMSHDAEPDSGEYREPTVLERVIPWRTTRRRAQAGELPRLADLAP